MTFGNLAGQTAGWLDGSGAQPALVVSSRVRLARNLQAIPFVHRASVEARRTVIAAVTACCGQMPEMTFFEADGLSDVERHLLVERHLISPALAKGQGPRGVLVAPDQAVSVMVNEEDHLRFQAILSGFQTYDAWGRARRLERELSEGLAYAFAPQWGYLTACPTNTGTGLRASLLVHLTGLVLTQEMEKVVRGVTQMGLTVRGFYGEGSEASGSLFQVSNQVTLGHSEEALLEALEKAVGQLLSCEENARETLMRDARPQIEDKVWRAYGLLKHARILTSQEVMNLSSAVRLGIALGILCDIDVRVLNRLMVSILPAHLQYFKGRNLSSHERDILRADVVRQQMTKFGKS